MRELFFKLFEKSHFNTGISVTAFSLSHIVYMLLIAGAIVGIYFWIKNKPAEKRDKILGWMAIILLISYISDFFVHEFVYAEIDDNLNLIVDEAGNYIGGGLNIDKLPFHICTVLCPIVMVTEHSKFFKKFIEPVTMLSILAPMMYLCYPASIGNGEPWCYQAVQTMFYHGLLMGWGILNVATGRVQPKIKNCWHSAILLVGITLWAKLGNILLEHNWFFLQEDAFYIGLVEMGIIPQWTLMVINPIVFFLAVLAIYGVVYGINALKAKFASKNETVNTAENA